MNNLIIRSTYRDYGHQFELEVVGECQNKNKEDCYLVRLLPQYQKSFQEGGSIHELRKSLIGGLYEIVSEDVQLKLF